MDISRKTKVLYVITKSNWGGAQRYVFDMATSLPSNFEPQVIVGGNGLLANKLKERNIPTTTLIELSRDIHIFKDIKIFFQLLHIFRKERPDVVHLNSSKIGGLGALAARIVGVPHIIFTAHGWAFNENRNFLVKKCIKFLHWLTILLSHTTITVSRAMKDQITDWPFISNKITVIRNGVDAIDFLSKDEARTKLGSFSSNIPWLGTIAELHHVKGHDVTLRALQNITTPFIYLVLGEGDERKHLETLVDQLGLNDKVFFLGHVEQAARYLKAFDIFILNSRSEGLGYVLLEAGSAQLPCIATNVGGIPEIIEDGVSGTLVPSENPTALEKAISKLLENKEIRQQQSQNLHQKVMNDFSKETMVTKTIDLY